MIAGALLLTVLIAAQAAPEQHSTPRPAPMSTKLNVQHFTNPGEAKTHPMSGQGCVSNPGALRAAHAVNPINGQAQAKTIVSVPITKGGGSVAASTTRAQQAEACAHTR